MIKLVKRWLLLVGLIYLASLVVGNITFTNGFTTMAILALIIMTGRWLFDLLEASLLVSINRASLNLAGLLIYILAVCFLSFLFNQVNFTVFTNQHLPNWLNNFNVLPGIYLAGFWSLLPFSAIIGTTDRFLIKPKS
ncbi:MAG: hypothetical protein PHR64_02975 [Candidatus Shapirobacteria bacterium]|nr:hypothetical protein [Candidatus Shapirobacteria bacterium]MDD5073952.1 hypothetical protein [Candidatus Shapirobacteria bacterium]MDD5481880.1 hypothetical protein [Candidatus Shapirobacteria bacterium]